MHNLLTSVNENGHNPFNSSTRIRYRLAKISHATLQIYDVAGRDIKTLVKGKQNAGEYAVTFDGSGLAAGIYFYSLSTAAGFIQSRKMILLK